jgi:hypothetical protein
MRKEESDKVCLLERCNNKLQQDARPRAGPIIATKFPFESQSQALLHATRAGGHALLGGGGEAGDLHCGVCYF